MRAMEKAVRKDLEALKTSTILQWMAYKQKRDPFPDWYRKYWRNLQKLQQELEELKRDLKKLEENL